jgi:hypothetical protein
MTQTKKKPNKKKRYQKVVSWDKSDFSGAIEFYFGAFVIFLLLWIFSPLWVPFWFWGHIVPEKLNDDRDVYWEEI